LRTESASHNQQRQVKIKQKKAKEQTLQKTIHLLQSKALTAFA
jgi:hypothetical protein